MQLLRLFAEGVRLEPDAMSKEDSEMCAGQIYDPIEDGCCEACRQAEQRQNEASIRYTTSTVKREMQASKKSQKATVHQ